MEFQAKFLENNTPFEIGEKNPHGEHFTGQSYLATLAQDKDVSVLNVTFEPGCRNFWHIHHGKNQILICVSGEGWYQEAGKPAQKLKHGDVVTVPADVRHWHGAAKNSWFSHIIPGVVDGEAGVTWLEPVSDEEYDALED